MPTKPIKAFIFQTLLWLPFTFGFWYLFAPWFTIPVEFLLDLLLSTLWPQWIESIERRGYLLEVITTIEPTLPPHVQLQPGQEAIFTFDINPLINAFGLPFLAALIAASPNIGKNKLLQLTLAWLLILLPAQLFSTTGMVLKVLVFNTTPEVMLDIAGRGIGVEIIALIYQFGGLILPSVTPVLVWMFLYHAYLQALAPQFGQVQKPRNP
jgi:hypothetical protein